MGRLNALKIKGLQPGRWGDGDGLWLQVRDAERRSWLFRYTLHGRAREMGLGPAGDVTLTEARDAARKCRALLREGIDPLDRRRQAAAAAREATQAITFREVADRYLAAHQAAWRNEKHRWQWRATLNIACKVFGNRPVNAIATGDVTRVLEPIWNEKTETASRLRGRIESVLDYAATRGWRTGENPARWKGHLRVILPAPAKIAPVQHHAALPWAEIGAFMGALAEQEGVAALALRFAILTAARTGEVIGATWGEIDLEGTLWTVPPERMKAGREHRVPLSTAALATLREAAKLRTSSDQAGFVFPGAKPTKPLSNMAMVMLLRRMGHADLTVHGFRSTFRDWEGEKTNHAHDVCEAALAHTRKDKAHAAYQRGDLFMKRRRLMDDWARFCAQPARAGEVVPMRRKESTGSR